MLIQSIGVYLHEQPKFTEKKIAEAEAKAAEALELMKAQVLIYLYMFLYKASLGIKQWMIF